MRKVITYGTYDLLHYGHINLLQRAKALGDYLIVGVTSDAFDKGRGKLNVQQSLIERIEGVKATGLADEIIIEEYEGQKIADIRKYGVDIFTVGSDWEGQFDYLNELCNVVYLSRTKDISSTELRAGQNPVISIGLIGLENPVERFLDESNFVRGVSIEAAYSDDEVKSKQISEKYRLKYCDSVDKLLTVVDAVYISTTIDKHYDYIMKALAAGCHVLCESPLFLSKAEAETAFALAQAKHLVLLEAVKTMFFPAFEHLLLIVGSGVIGMVKDIEVSFSQIPSDEDMQNQIYRGSMYDLGAYVLLPIVKILGAKYSEQVMYCYRNADFNVFTKGVLRYPHATASFKAGKGLKTEGNLIITGTRGYIYVPAPWWKTEYFEIRYEDLRNTKKYFYKYEGEGLRYELLEFVRLINSGAYQGDKYTKDEMIAVTGIIEEFDKGNVKLI